MFPHPLGPALGARLEGKGTYCRIADIERVHEAGLSGECPEVAEQTVAVKRAHPGMKMFEVWARQRAGKAPLGDKDWNQLSVGDREAVITFKFQRAATFQSHVQYVANCVTRGGPRHLPRRELRRPRVGGIMHEVSRPEGQPEAAEDSAGVSVT
ncbi:hypothetical protein B0H17DRAFT_1154971 [Mycena rosella]|uniref:Uncharacterized protein n=1 Tax=Mycena rosella TaxID=1033263 RepID=A0AAD7F8B0_MYCRO|nr:hypothetical protein B0H17DRAFT_1154971 [Mycena rosella]